MAPSKACLPLTVTLAPLGALSLTSRLAVSRLLVVLFSRCADAIQHAGLSVVEVLVDQLHTCLLACVSLALGSMAQLTSLAALLRSP